VDVIKEPPKPKELKQMEERKKEIRETVEDVVDGIGEQVRAAREKMGLKQDELAKKINEHESMVRRVEHGYIPSVAIARKLGKVLHLKLVEASDANEQGYTTGKGAGELTLGDIIVIKKGKK
jgi:putative transcription factor